MTNMWIRAITILAALAVLLAGAAFLVGGRTDILDLRAAGIVLGVPLLIALVTRRPTEVLAALHDGLSSEAQDLPVSRRSRSADILHGLAGQSLAIGVLMLFAGGLHYLGSPAEAGGSVSPAALISNFGGLLLAPFYGLAASALIYAPLGTRLGAPSR